MKGTQMNETEQFFYDQAGWGYNPSSETPEEGRTAGAIRLADAEKMAQDAGYTFSWSDDWEIGNHKEFFGADSAYADSEPDTCENCDMFDPDGNLVQSLGCIDDASSQYRRVVEAELALEQFADSIA